MQIKVNHPNCPETYQANKIKISNETVYMIKIVDGKEEIIRTIMLQPNDTMEII